MINRKPRIVEADYTQIEARIVAHMVAEDILPIPGEVTGDQMLKEVIEEVSLDRYLDRSPKLGTPINYPEMVGVLQRKRQMFITAEAKRKSGIKDEGDENVEVV